MDISLSQEFAQFAKELVSQGAAASVEEIVAEALKEYQHSVEALREELRPALESLDRGEGIPADQVFAELEQRYRTQIT